MRNSLLLCLIIVVFWSCNRRPKDVVSEDKMADVIAEMTVAESYSNRPGRVMLTDSDKRVVRQSILIRHGMNEAEFDSTLMWYGRNMEKYSGLYAKVDKILEKKESRITVGNENKKVEESIWPLSEMISLSPGGLYDGFSFEVPGKDIALGDALQWKMKLTRLVNGATMVMIAEYKGGKRSVARRGIRDGGNVELILKTDSALGRLDRVIGYFQLTDRPPMKVWADSIQLVRIEGRGVQ